MSKQYKKPVRLDLRDFPAGAFEISKIVDDAEGLHVVLSTEKDLSATFEVSFDAVHAYRNADEGDRTEYWRSLGGYLETGCYTAEESDFLDWALDQNVHGALPRGLQHFIVVSANDVLDVLSFESPNGEVVRD